jgi:peptide/nickel transport system substrate-binding protein
LTHKAGRWLLAGALLASVALAACGDDDDDAARDTAPAATSATSDAAAPDSVPDGTDAPGTTEAPVDDRETDPNATVRIASFFSVYWDPAVQPSGFSISFLGLVYDRLVHTDPDGSLVPGLAESWEYSDDGLSLTLHLREGVTFQDGAPFDAEAVKANLDRSRTLENATVKPDLARIEEVVVVDPLTVRLDLASPDATLPAILSGAAGAMASPAALDDPELDRKPVGAGPFTLTSFQPDSDFVLERWDGYWNADAVRAKRMEVRVLPDTSARVNALRSGEVDLAPIEPADVATLSNIDGIEVLSPQTTRYVYLAMNLAEEPLDVLEVRQAISHAIDRQALVDGLYEGLGEPTVQPWPEGYFPHVDGLEERYPYDPERARELLAEAGYADGFSAEIIAVPQPVVYAQLGEAVQAQLAEVGIDLSVKITEASQLGDAFYVNKETAFALLYTNGSIDPATTIGSRFSANGFFNPGKYSTPRLEELYQQALSTTDPAERAAVFQDVSREIVDQVLDMPLFFAREPVAVSEKVVGFVPYVTGRPDYRFLGIAS